MPFQIRPRGPSRSHAVSRRHSSSDTMRPVHVRGRLAQESPCGKILGVCISPRTGLSLFRFWARGVAALATTATLWGGLSAFGHERCDTCDTCDNRDTGAVERGTSPPSISARTFCASNHMARTFHDAPAFGPCRPAYHRSWIQRHKPPMAF